MVLLHKKESIWDTLVLFKENYWDINLGGTYFIMVGGEGDILILLKIINNK